MPTIRIENLPQGAILGFDPENIKRLYELIDDLIGVTGKTSILVIPGQHIKLLPHGGFEDSKKVRVHILWHFRSFEIRDGIVKAVSWFLGTRDFNDVHVTFTDHPEGMSFWANGKWHGEIPRMT